MKMFGLAAVLLALVAAAQCEIELDEGVLVLTSENFQEALDANPIILVEFYAPWCGHCKKLAPEYASAAQTLATDGSTAKLAKVDATEQKDLAGRYGVRGYPTLKLFRNGQPMDYSGGRTADAIVAYMNKKSGPPAETLETVEAADALVEKAKVAVIGFFKDTESEEAKAFLQTAGSLDDQLFGITSSSEVFAKFEVTGDSAVVLFKKFDEGKNVLEGEMTAASVKQFVKTNAVPLVIDFNQDTAKAIFGDNNIKAHFIIFTSAQDEDHEYKIHEARKVAKDYKGKMMFVVVTTDEKEHQRVLDFFNIFETPTYRIALAQENFKKYKPESAEFKEASMRAFVEQYYAGTLIPDIKTEEVPADWDAAPVKVLVGKNFAEVAMDESKDVFVEFYAPWCGHCKSLAPIWDELGEKFKDEADLVIAKMDATANEVEGLHIKGFPTIKLFKKGDNSVVDYSGDRTLDGFVKFLRPEQAEEAAAAPEEEAEVKEAAKDEL